MGHNARRKTTQQNVYTTKKKRLCFFFVCYRFSSTFHLGVTSPTASQHFMISYFTNTHSMLMNGMGSLVQNKLIKHKHRGWMILWLCHAHIREAASLHFFFSSHSCLVWTIAHLSPYPGYTAVKIYLGLIIGY